MSHGQTPRTREHFPRMRVRGRRRLLRQFAELLRTTEFIAIDWRDLKVID